MDPKVWKQAVPVGWVPQDFITVQKWASSKDGTRIPIFITHHKDAVLDGSNPTVLYAYGGCHFFLPTLSPVRMAPAPSFSCIFESRSFCCASCLEAVFILCDCHTSD